MIIGEAPGRKEIEEGRPFVGRAGKLLETLLRSLGVNREDVYITNVVKELPLNSEGKIRRPYDEEIIAWGSVLSHEIQNTAPEAILALGRTATGALTGLPADQLPFGSKVGNVYTAWHPSFLLHQGVLGEQTDYGRWDEWLEQIRPWAWAIGADE
jgi:DNA polymerase